MSVTPLTVPAAVAARAGSLPSNALAPDETAARARVVVVPVASAAHGAQRQRSGAPGRAPHGPERVGQSLPSVLMISVGPRAGWVAGERR